MKFEVHVNIYFEFEINTKQECYKIHDLVIINSYRQPLDS